MTLLFRGVFWYSGLVKIINTLKNVNNLWNVYLFILHNSSVSRIQSNIKMLISFVIGNTYKRFRHNFYFFKQLLTYRVFRPDLTYFEDLGGHLKTTLKSKSKYLCIPEVWAFEFPQSVFKKVTKTGLNSLRQKRC